MRVLFARIGYMKFYQGPKPGDEKPIGGGSYNTEEIGHEVFNFLNIGRNVYGYFQPHMKEPYQINLARIEQGYSDDKIDQVLVVWFATNPIDKGQVVVGWYKNATVFRSIQTPTSLPQRENYDYNVKARTSDCVLLPISKRRFPVGHDISGTKEGKPGQANAFYLLDDKGNKKDLKRRNNEWISSVIKFVNSYSGLTISSPEDEIQEDMITAGISISTGGQGLQSNVEIRLMIESYAMNLCKKFYSEKGYDVEDVSPTHSYDVSIKKNGVERKVEVKGTQTEGNAIILTRNEVDLSRSQGKDMTLFLVHSIVMNKKAVRNGSGVIKIIDPWQVTDDRLTPLSYTYRLS